jgi:HAE1 family hydrophobic/amphiphilic exporter-1
MEFKLSIIEWAVSRLNPILVTTITTVAGILPIALQDPFWAGLWFTIAFGLTTWSFMTLFVIPTLYYSLEKRKYRN